MKDTSRRNGISYSLILNAESRHAHLKKRIEDESLMLSTMQLVPRAINMFIAVRGIYNNCSIKGTHEKTPMPISIEHERYSAGLSVVLHKVSKPAPAINCITVRSAMARSSIIEGLDIF
jgi:hypothetical protein